jgi:hypothetical protein
MPIQPVKDINEYKRLKKSLQDRFENERSGEQELFREQTKIFKPIITANQETSKAIQDKIVEESVNKALEPLTKELKRRNDQIDMLSEQPFYQQEIPAISGPSESSKEIYATPEPSKDFMQVDLDNGLNETDIENLQDMSLELPSKVFELSKDPDNNIFEETFKQIKTYNKSLSQLTRSDNKKRTEQEKEIFKSRHKTVEKYNNIIRSLEGSKKFISTPKQGKGLKNTQDYIIYPYTDINELVVKLNELHAAKQAGNTGVHNKIISLLDELLRVKAISKGDYDNLYKNIFI